MGKKRSRRAKARVKMSPRAPVFGWTQHNYTTSSDLRQNKRVAIIAEDGQVLAEYPSYGLLIDWQSMARKFETKDFDDKELGKISVVYVPASMGYVTEIDLNAKPKKRPLMCTYDAVKNYCESLLGVKFAYEDSEFFESHPLVQEDGVPFPDTLRVVQELITPYNLRISRVRVAPNYGVPGDIKQWRKVLGINPMALADRVTTNAEFAAKMDGKVDVSHFRFDHGSEALFPSVSCGVIGSVQGVTGSTGGHAVYVPPRRRATGALLSFQIARAEHAIWRVEPVFPDLATIVASKKLIKAYDTKAWYDKHEHTSYTVGAGWNKAKETAKAVTKAITGPVVHPKIEPPTISKGSELISAYGYTWNEHGIVVTEDGAPACYRCRRAAAQRRHTFEIPGLCDSCWLLVCLEINCTGKKCKKLDKLVDQELPNPPFRFASMDWQAQRLYFQCNRPGCHTVFYGDRSHGAKVINAMKAIQQYRLMQEQLESDLTKLVSLKTDAPASAETVIEAAVDAAMATITDEEIQQAYDEHVALSQLPDPADAAPPDPTPPRVELPDSVLDGGSHDAGFYD